MTRPDDDMSIDRTPPPFDPVDETVVRSQATTPVSAAADDATDPECATADGVGDADATGDWSGRTVAEPVRLDGDAPLGRVADRGRYSLHGEIARGGMGVVIRARDAELGRELAFKVLLEQHRARPEVIRRFVEEAQIGGQLQHPGIVPVYDLGTLEDRRPFFAMKLVRGCTLAALLGERSDPSEDLPRFLGIFELVGQTVAYAHSKRVIHRDLKPANIRQLQHRYNAACSAALAGSGQTKDDPPPDQAARVKLRRRPWHGSGPSWPRGRKHSTPAPRRPTSSSTIPSSTGKRIPTWPASATPRRWRNFPRRNGKPGTFSGGRWTPSRKRLRAVDLETRGTRRAGIEQSK